MSSMALYNNRNSKIKIFELLKKIYNSCRNRFLKNKMQSTYLLYIKEKEVIH